MYKCTTFINTYNIHTCIIIILSDHNYRNGSNHTYDVTYTQHNAEASETVNIYENISLQDARLSAAQQHVKPTAENNENNVNMENNPSYLAVSNSQVK